MRNITQEQFYSNYCKKVILKYSNLLNPKICDEISRWNGVYHYNQFTTNCQKFTRDILKILEINDPFPGKIKEIVNNLCTAEAQAIHFIFFFSQIL